MKVKKAVIDNNGRGIFSSRKWILDGDAFLASSGLVKEKIDEISEEKDGFVSSLSLVEGFRKSAVIMLGYSAEFYLKSGILKLYRGLDEELFVGNLKEVFRHKIKKMIAELGFLELIEDYEYEASCLELILSDGRYPEKDGNSIAQVKIGGRGFDDLYHRLVIFVESIKCFCLKIDGSRDSPSFAFRREIDDDGYIFCRLGGGVPSRGVVKFSSVQDEEGKNKLEFLMSLLKDSDRYMVEQVLKDGNMRIVYKENKLKPLNDFSH